MLEKERHRKGRIFPIGKGAGVECVFNTREVKGKNWTAILPLGSGQYLRISRLARSAIIILGGDPCVKKLPIGIQSFIEIRTEGYYYVDKTRYVRMLVDEGKYFFLSRPRRFGKSLFLDTLKQAFLGRKELFEGLYLENNWDWSQVYPVIHISFGSGVYSQPDELTYKQFSIIEDHAKKYEVELSKEGANERFMELIKNFTRNTKEKWSSSSTNTTSPFLIT